MPKQRILEDGRPVVWEPTPRQAEFLSASDDEVLYGGAAGGGKGLRANEVVLTPFGWKEIGKLKPGDKLCAIDGTVTHVLQVFHRGMQPFYRCHFSDGTHVDCDADHLWFGWRSRQGRKIANARTQGEASARKYSMAELVTLLGSDRKRMVRFGTPLAQPMAFNVAGQLVGPGKWIGREIPPYVLGVLLGDGALTQSVRFTSADSEIPDRVERELAGLPVRLSRHGGRDGECPSFALVSDGWMQDRLRALGVMGCGAADKRIPKCYLFATIPERWALLQGLMDTDGWADKDGEAYFCTISQGLREDVAHLARSLGALVTVREKEPFYRGADGERVLCSTAYTLRIKLPDNGKAFSLTRKVATASGKIYQSLARWMDRIEPIEPAESVCIQVAHPSSLFITKDFIVTHNSDAMLVDALGMSYGAHLNPRHRAIIFRRTFPELKALIDRACELYPQVVGGKYNKVEHVYTLPSGATIQFGHLQNDDARLLYRSGAYNFIGFEEMTLWSTPVCWEYLASRNRSSDPTLPCYMRANTNPDGPGQKWVMERWGIDELGGPTLQTRELQDERELENGEFEEYTKVKRIRFIPARLTDNPYLRGTGYRARLNDLPPDDRDALLNGLWRGNKVRGAYYVNEMAKARQEGRIRANLPLAPAVPINTYWDLGKNDNTSIWFHQYVAQEHRFPLAFEDSGEELEYYVEKLRAFQAERKWTYGVHYLPHDAEHKRLGAKYSIKEQLERLMPGQVFVVVPVISRVIDGINMTRSKFGQCWFDKDGCADGLAALDAYRKKWNARTGTWLGIPEHDQFSNYADAFRQFGQGWRVVTASKPAARPVVPRSRGPV